MPPTIFFVAGAGLLVVLIGYMVTELARPWPDRQARKEKERREAIRAKRHQEEDEMAARAEEMLKEQAAREEQSS